MPQPIGITFAPTPDAAEMGKKNMALQGGSPEAIQILSLHLPKFTGARPLAPNDLLTAQPSSPGSAVVDSILQQMGLAPAPATSMGAPSESNSLAELLRNATGGVGNRYAPPPHVSPGVETGAQAPTPPLAEWKTPTEAPTLPDANPGGLVDRAREKSHGWNDGGFDSYLR